MKDIDFDELDKAVNSLMGGVKSKSDREEAKTLTIATTLKEGEQPAYDKIQHAAERIGSETLTSPTEKTAVLTTIAEDQVNVISLPGNLEASSTTPLIEPIPPVVNQTPVVETPPVVQPSVLQAPAAPKAPSGRFMDVMHPSSDMKTASTSQAPAVRPLMTTPNNPPTTIPTPSSIVVPNRQAAVVSVVPPAELTQPQPVAEAVPVAQTPELPQQPTVVAAPPATVAPQPTPATPETVSPLVDPVVVEPVVVSETLVVTETIEAPEPLISPFLPDAKVEKRPLGGSSDQVSGDADDIDSLDHPYSVDNSSDTQLAPAQIDRPDLPAELGTDLLAIETNVAEPTESSSITAESSVSEGAKLSGGDAPVDGAVFDTTDYQLSLIHI